MIKVEEIIKKEKVIKSVVCDICKKEYDDPMELQEFASISTVGGYCSVFGDGTEIEIDICQYCLKEKLGEWLRTKEFKITL